MNDPDVLFPWEKEGGDPQAGAERADAGDAGDAHTDVESGMDVAGSDEAARLAGAGLGRIGEVIGSGGAARRETCRCHARRECGGYGESGRQRERIGCGRPGRRAGCDAIRGECCAACRGNARGNGA